MHKKTQKKRGKKRLFTSLVANGGAILRGLAPGQHLSEETSQQLRAAGDTLQF